MFFQDLLLKIYTWTLCEYIGDKEICFHYIEKDTLIKVVIKNEYVQLEHGRNSSTNIFSH